MLQAKTTASEQVVHKVASATQCDPLELPPLYHAINPEALDEVVAGMEGGEVSFTYAGFKVAVNGEGAVQLDRR